ncbi:hypothetical protein HDV00_004347 [Rhizophlyctis rosea]|nr:hypothetical protein HDV00_004347 [Rhizophlyctis rosea]
MYPEMESTHYEIKCIPIGKGWSVPASRVNLLCCTSSILCLPRLSVQRVVKVSTQLDPVAVTVILTQGRALYGARVYPEGDDVYKFTQSVLRLARDPDDTFLITAISIHINTFNFFLLPNADLLEAVAKCLTNCSNHMVEFLDTISRKGLKIPEIRPILNGHVTIRAINNIRTRYMASGNRIAAVTDYLQWFHDHHFTTIPDAHFQNAGNPLSTDFARDASIDDRRIQTAFDGIRSQADWQSYVTLKALHSARSLSSAPDGKRLLEWFDTHGFPLTVDSIDSYSEQKISRVRFGTMAVAALQEDCDFLRKVVPTRLLREVPVPRVRADGEGVADFAVGV